MLRSEHCAGRPRVREGGRERERGARAHPSFGGGPDECKVASEDYPYQMLYLVLYAGLWIRIRNYLQIRIRIRNYFRFRIQVKFFLTNKYKAVKIYRFEKISFFYV
jgi:hypothetical protein